jgi:APA family basic amino acid/polyamine antiporter
VAALLCVSILASASAMTAQGPRVYYAFGQDFPPVAWLTRVSPTTGSPVHALQLQGIVTTVIILSGRVDQIIQYAGFTLTFFASLAVSCVMFLRIRRPESPRPFRAWGYPFTPVLFLAVSAWTMIWAVRGRPVESLLGLATAVMGGVLCVVFLRRSRRLNG